MGRGRSHLEPETDTFETVCGQLLQTSRSSRVTVKTKTGDVIDLVAANQRPPEQKLKLKHGASRSATGYPAGSGTVSCPRALRKDVWLLQSYTSSKQRPLTPSCKLR
ncbi:hypothetical protein PAMP_016710 [Pampus punctatissimus]